MSQHCHDNMVTTLVNVTHRYIEDVFYAKHRVNTGVLERIQSGMYLVYSSRLIDVTGKYLGLMFFLQFINMLLHCI
jgi:hypothetical protein